AAREVTKTSTSRLETFRSHDLGMLGYADADGCVAIYRKPARRHAPDTEFDVRGRRELPRVDVAYSYAGADGAAVEAFVAAGARGIVTASLAPGANTTAELDALRAARARGVLIVQCTRAGSGRVLPRAVFREHGFVPADNLNPQKARVLTLLALTRTDDPGELGRVLPRFWGAGPPPPARAATFPDIGGTHAGSRDSWWPGRHVRRGRRVGRGYRGREDRRHRGRGHAAGRRRARDRRRGP